MTTPGNVFLVGAGPGDPGLLTLRGRQCLEQADVVLYDYLAGVRVLKWTRPEAQRYCLGRHGQGKLWSQHEINACMVEHAQAGRTVVRLKGGDPSVFGRLAEEIDALTAASVPFEIVPGVTTAVAAGAYAGVTLTDRDRASCVTLVTGHEQPEKAGELLDWDALAKTPGTLVVYMGVTTAAQWSEALMLGGKPAGTPVLLVRRCSLPDQQSFECTLGDLAGILAPGKVRPPVIAIVGPVASRPAAHEWFTARPLFGQTVLVTRPRHQAEEMVGQLADLGAATLVQPAIRIDPPREVEPLREAVTNTGSFDWIAFSSRNGVEAFFRAFYEAGLDARALAGVKIAAIGPSTAETLAEQKLTADLCPGEYRAEALAEALSNEARCKRFLLVRASRGREVLADMLRQAGGKIHQVVAYESTDIGAPDPDIAEQMAAGSIAWTTVTSSAIARSLVRLFGDSLHRTRLAAISPLTASVLQKHGFSADAVANEYTTEGLVRAIVDTTA